MTISIRYLFITFFILCTMSAPHGFALDESASPLAKKAKQIVLAAHEYVAAHSSDMEKVQKALENDPRFSDHEQQLYIFMHCYNAAEEEAICCGQGIRPDLVGKNMWHLRSPTGRLLFHEFEKSMETHGAGWFEYEWLNPYSKTIQTKHSYMKKIVLSDGRTAWIGTGYWKE